MRNLSTAYKTSASGDTRNYTINLHVWKKTVDDNGNVSFPSSSKATYTSGNDLISMSIVDGQTSGNSFQLGQTFCPIISFTTVPNLNIKTGDKVQVELVFTSAAKATLATGYVDEYSYDSIDYAVSYTAYGKMLQLDKDYNSSLTYPATFSAIVREICSQNGLAFDTFAWKCNAKLKAKPVFGNLDNGDPAYASAREMLGIIAGVNGCNVIVTAEEKVKFVPYTDTKTGITYEDAFSRQVNNEKYVIKKAVLNDGGQTSGDEAGYVELYFPLETVEGKASCLAKLNSVITGLSVMGMTVQTQGRGYYEIGDMLSYTDFDGEKYTIGVMGIKYDFSGGYFTETLYSLAPSEMEEQHKGNVRYSSASTTLKNPVVISENTSSYLGYQYHTIGYKKGDKITYGQDGKSNIIVQGYIAKPPTSSRGEECGNFIVTNGVHYKGDISRNFTKLKTYIVLKDITPSDDPTKYWYVFDVLSEITNGEVVKTIKEASDLKTSHGDFSLAVQWRIIYAPTEQFPNGAARVRLGVMMYSSNIHGYLYYEVNDSIDVSFASIAEYNAAVQLSGESLTKYDVTQDVTKIGEADEPTDLPTIGDVDTLYITYQPPACWKYSTITNKYYCVGRNYRELQRIKSSTEESTALEVFNVPVIFDCRTKTEWELEANTVYPKGFMIFEQEADTREVTKLKIANGIDKLSELKYTNVTESELPTKTSQLENDSGFLTAETDPTVPAWAKSDTKPTYTASEVGAATVADIKAAVDDIEIGGRNYLLNTKSFTSASSTSLNGSLITGTSLLEEKYRDLVIRGCTLAKGETVVCKYNFTDFNLGDTFTFSFYAKGDVSELRAYFYGNPGYVQVAKCVNSQGATSTNYDGWSSFYITSDWQRYWVTWTLKSTGDISVPKYVLLRTKTEISGQTVYVCGCKFEKGNKATDWSPAPEDVNHAIDNIQVGGRNLLLNTGKSSSIIGTNTADQCLAHHDLACGSIVNLEPGVYTCSADIIGTVEGGTAHMQFYGPPWETIPEMSGNVTVKTTKQKIGGTFTLSSPQAFSATGMRVRTDYVSGTITVSNMKLEKGNKPTDWTPAPEDDERRIASLEARVAALEAAAVSGGE